MFVLNNKEPNKLAHFLIKRHWLANGEIITSMSKPGEGNMNYVLRITTSSTSFILKQSRAYVEKYPQIAAPEKRVVTEAKFYTKISENPSIQKRMPKILGLDIANNIMLLEDLGMANDYTTLYALDKKISDDDIHVLIIYLNDLHHGFKKSKVDDELSNLELRKLNYEHIFHYPFLECNGFDLNMVQAGLQELAQPYKRDTFLKQKIEHLGELYMSKGAYLLHGDYYPGSWLSTENGIKIIDPEFCFYGQREFDLGVLIAHLILTKHEQSIIDKAIENYKTFRELNMDMLNGFIGVEIMRRLIGLAQLPLQMALIEKEKLMGLAYHLITQKR
ncbi:aminoglycoside phosphotransferase [Gaetbulibacter sp. M235]